MSKPHSINLAPGSSPAVVTVSKSFGRSAPDLAAKVAWSVEQVLGDRASQVHVKVKRAGPINRFGVEHRGRLVTFRQKKKAVAFARSRGVKTMSRLSRPPEPGVKGWAYDGIPFSALEGCDYLITLSIGSERNYPAVLEYRKTSPIHLASAEQELVAIAAHEARHCYQYMHGLPRSEVECDRIAIAVVKSWEAGNRPRTGGVQLA
jgi:hypothetical protein